MCSWEWVYGWNLFVKHIVGLMRIHCACFVMVYMEFDMGIRMSLAGKYFRKHFHGYYHHTLRLIFLSVLACLQVKKKKKCNEN